MMFLEKIKSEGIAHLSYVLGDGLDAVVIDPRRDCQIYAEIAAQHGTRITRIFETHRNEDYIIGSMDLARRTGATIHHGRSLDFSYGAGVSEGDTFEVGDLCLKILETPGHTFESISIVVTDKNYGEDPVAVFTGDALFIGDVGRTDFFPDQARKVAGALYDSIFEKLLPLGDQAIIYPAHGAGSVCGDNMATREFSTIGHERLHNPVLKKTDRESFIDFKVSEHHYQPPYFKKMEEHNQYGPPPLHTLPRPVPLKAGDVKKARTDGAVLLDLRSPEAYAGAFIPGSLAMPLEMIPAYAGYFLDYDTDIILVPETREQIPAAVAHLIRIGYDRVSGYLKGGMHSWEVEGMAFDRIGAVHAKALEQRLKNEEDLTLLDVRKIGEYRQGRLAGAVHIFLGELPDRIHELDPDKPVITFCGSGKRAIIAAAILKKNGFSKVEDSLGSMSACKNVGCALQEG
ncbi:MAG: MBL fold metallo-hydrolase [Desulfotignum sp.]|jgi:hydroxyacylglutathione hydrolase|nr:MBL fold metallo-hydrolase [Desulfotignum sp.]